MISTNEKTAKKIAKILNDWEIDPEQVGVYMARISPNNVITKLQVITNSAILEATITEEDHGQYKLF